MSNADIIGIVAAVLTTGSFVPQAAKVLQTRDTAAISLAMYSMFTCGIALWLAFGIFTLQWPIIIANAVTLVLAGLILAIKVRAVLVAARTSRKT